MHCGKKIELEILKAWVSCVYRMWLVCLYLPSGRKFMGFLDPGELSLITWKLDSNNWQIQEFSFWWRFGISFDFIGLWKDFVQKFMVNYGYLMNLKSKRWGCVICTLSTKFCYKQLNSILIGNGGKLSILTLLCVLYTFEALTKHFVFVWIP